MARDTLAVVPRRDGATTKKNIRAARNKFFAVAARATLAVRRGASPRATRAVRGRRHDVVPVLSHAYARVARGAQAYDVANSFACAIVRRTSILSRKMRAFLR